MSATTTATAADEALRSWLSAVAEGIDARPIALARADEVRGGGRPPVAFRVRYLVTASTLAALEAVLLAATDRPGVDVDLDAPPLDLWRALELPPQPAVWLTVMVRHERDEPQAPRVLTPLVVRGDPLRSINGRLVGPGDVPLAGARVELVATRQATRTAHDGRFRFDAAPTEAPARFSIAAKGAAFVADVDLDVEDDEVLIRCDPLEV